MKTKALFGLWSEMKVPDINRILKPHGVRLVMKRSKVWGKQVSVTAHPAEVVKRARAPREPTPQAPTDPVEPRPKEDGCGADSPSQRLSHDVEWPAASPTHPITIE